MASPQPQASRHPAITTDAETAEPWREIRATVFAMAVGWPWGSRGLRIVRRRPIAGKSRRILMPPRGRQGIDVKRLEHDGPQHLVEMDPQQRVKDMAHTGIMDRRPRKARLQP